MTSQPSKSSVVWTLRVAFFLTAAACVYVLGGGAWFFGGLTLGWLWSVMEYAALQEAK